jgi:hypothetical protein
MLNHQTKNVCLVCQDSEEKVLVLHKTRRQTHSMCYSCLVNYISDPIEKLVELAKTGNLINGPVVKCPGSYTGLQRNRCKCDVLIPESISFEETEKVSCNVRALYIISKVENTLLCPHESCLGIIFRKDFFGEEATCAECNRSMCMSCATFPYHTGMNCDDYNSLKKDGLHDLVSNGIVKSCPKCKSITEKNEGCNKMYCIKCGTKWCWLCLETDIDYNHYNENSKTPCSNLLWEGVDVNNQGVEEHPHIHQIVGRINRDNIHNPPPIHIDQVDMRRMQYEEQINDNNYEIGQRGYRVINPGIDYMYDSDDEFLSSDEEND